MCYHPVKVNSVSGHGATFSFVPCGKCEECRQSSKNAWSFRLCAEIEQRVRDGWHVGFCTLTVDDDHMSYLDRNFFKNPDLAPSNIRCFSKPQVQLYIQNIRKHLWRDARVKDISYFVASELGAAFGRPHYHMLICWPSVGQFRVKDSNGRYIRDGRVERREERPLTAEYVHDVCKRFWKLGFFMPRYVEGGIRHDGVRLQAFEVQNCGVFAAKYCAKYVCKDLQFDRVLNGLSAKYEFTDDDELYKLLSSIQFPFHLQSRSLGLRFLKSCSDEEKYDLLISGHHFAGDDEEKFVQLPLYFKNKLFFEPDYMLDECGKRVVRRKASSFFRENFAEIFDRKVNFYSQLLDNCVRYDFWMSRECTREQSFTLSNTVSKLLGEFDDSVTFDSLAADYLAFYAVDYDNCYDVSRPLKWFARYIDIFVDTSDGVAYAQPIGNEFDFSSCDKISYDYWQTLNSFWTIVFKCLAHTNGWMKHDLLGDYVRDFYASRSLANVV